MDFLDRDTWLSIFETISPYIDTADKRRQTISTFLPDMLDTGYSGAEALDIFKEAGLGIQTSAFYDIRRDILADTNLTSNLRMLDLDEIVSDSMMRVSSKEMETKYFHLASYAFTDDNGENAVFGQWGFYTDEQYTKGEILERISDVIRARYPEYTMTLTTNLRKSYIDLRK